MRCAYASPQCTGRKEFWIYLMAERYYRGSTLVCSGDFIIYLFEDEKKGGVRNGNRPCKLFKEWLLHCDMMDLGFQGSKLTWSDEFIEETLRAANFLNNFIKLTIFWSSSVSMQVLWNGTPS